MPRPPNRTLVFVLPWSLRPPPSGVEGQTAAMARRLASAGARVEIWTTTAHPGEKEGDLNTRGFPAGDTIEDGLAVRRFLAAPCDARAFERLQEKIRRGRCLEWPEESAYFRNGVWSEGMRRAIHNRRQEALYLFAPAFAATTVFGLPAAPQESVLLPFLREEKQAGFRMVWETISACHHVLFNADPEGAAVQRLFDLEPKRCLAAAGIDYAEGEPPIESPLPPAVRKPYALFLGRQGEEHGTAQLIEHFQRLAGDSPLSFQLVLAGHGEAKAPPGRAGWIASLGRVKEETKWALLANALCFVLPSTRETVSFSLLESWAARRPAVVNAGGSVAAALARGSSGGLSYRTYAEFRHILETLARNPELAEALGERGNAYVRTHFRWSEAVDRLVRFLRDIEQWLAEGDLAA